MIKTASKIIAEKVASNLLKIEAIKLKPSDPFTWSSGWKSPIYCDNRLSLSYPKIRTEIKEFLAASIQSEFNGVDAIAGVATAGIPQGALVADILDLPFIYVRSKPKGHGMENMIEGHVDKGAKVVLVEDLVSTGGSSLKAAEALIAAGCEAIGMVAIFTYGFDVALENYKKAGIPLFCLCDYGTMLEAASKEGYVKESDIVALKSWRVDPANWK